MALTHRELAVRLAYFLWSAPPNKDLLELVAQGSLSDATVLREQTTRLLSSPRADQFIEAFAHQWLDMARLDMFDFYSLQHPTFDESVRRSARHEVFATIRHVMDSHLPLETMLSADFLVVNEVLGLHYGLQENGLPVIGGEFRKVTIPDGMPRGGLLGQAGRGPGGGARL